jgi:hypothetical protein
MQGEAQTSRSAGRWRPTHGLMPAMHTGDVVHLFIQCEPSQWKRAEVVVTWTGSPRLMRGRRLRRMPLQSITERPVLVREGINETTGSMERTPEPEPVAVALPDLQSDFPFSPGRLRVLARLRLRRRLLTTP